MICCWLAPAILMSRTRNAISSFCSRRLSISLLHGSKSSRAKPVIDSSKALPPQATFRGPYINTGSHDIGPDRQTYQKK
ncbi:unnamed protein product [Camellia sinensis]